MKKSFIYTGTGDQGSTSLVGGKRVDKDSVRIEAYGTVDELNAQISMLATAPTLQSEAIPFLIKIQNKLFNIGAHLASEGETHIQGLTEADITTLETQIDEMDNELPPLTSFVIPGGSRRAALCHVCRTVARRAERRVVALSHESYVDPLVIKYLNRLSDYFFVFARFNNVRNQFDEIFWDKNC
jgi:cob(I)alamin adenosyltransferase